MNLIVQILRWILFSFVGLAVVLGVYLSAAYIFGVFTCNSDFKEDNDGITIYIKSNGVHTDLVFPIQNQVYDWSTLINKSDFYPMASNFIAFGWGDRGFYLETPTWADLKAETAFKALFWLGSGAMHVTLYENIKVGDKTRKLKISPKQYEILVAYVQQSFQYSDQKIVPIPGHHYDNVNDNFYDATGTYNFLFTCNSWTNDALKKAGIKTAIWAPFEWSVMRHRIPNDIK